MNAIRLLAVALLFATPANADEPKPAITYEGHVKAILAKRCAKCHTGDRPRGDFDITTLAGIMQGGVTGKAVVAGKPDASPLYTMTAHLEEPKMPPGQPKIPQTEIDTLAKWIEGGLIEKSGVTVPTVEPKAVAPAGGLVVAAPLPRRTPITALAVNPTAPLVAVPGKKQVLLFELPTGKLLGGLPFPEGEVHALKFSADGKLLLAAGGVGGQSGAAVGIEVGTWKRQFTITDDSDAILAADISPDKSHVAFGGPARVVKVVSVKDGKLLHTLRKATDWVLAVGFSPDGLLVAAGDRFGGVFLWETNSGKEFAVLKAHTKAVTGLAWRADGDALATVGEDRTARVWDLHKAAEVRSWDAHEEGVLGVAWQGASISTAGRDGMVRVWDAATAAKAAEFGPLADAAMKVAFTGDGKTVVAGDWSGAVAAWPVGGGKAVELTLPVEKPRTDTVVIAVPTPKLVPVVPEATVAVAPPAVSSTDLDRKRAALKAVEDAAEKLKEEAARNPGNPALAKAYLQLCKAALTMKAEVIAAETGDRK